MQGHSYLFVGFSFAQTCILGNFTGSKLFIFVSILHWITIIHFPFNKHPHFCFIFPQDCMEEINLFSENKSHLKQLGEQLLLASNEAKQTQVRGSLQEVNQRWHNLFHHIEAR